MENGTTATFSALGSPDCWADWFSVFTSVVAADLSELSLLSSFMEPVLSNTSASSTCWVPYSTVEWLCRGSCATPRREAVVVLMSAVTVSWILPRARTGVPTTRSLMSGSVTLATIQAWALACMTASVVEPGMRATARSAESVASCSWVRAVTRRAMSMEAKVPIIMEVITTAARGAIAPAPSRVKRSRRGPAVRHHRLPTSSISNRAQGAPPSACHQRREHRASRQGERPLTAQRRRTQARRSSARTTRALAPMRRERAAT